MHFNPEDKVKKPTETNSWEEIEPIEESIEEGPHALKGYGKGWGKGGKGLTCYHCHKPGHRLSECPDKDKEMAAWRKGKGEGNNSWGYTGAQNHFTYGWFGPKGGTKGQGQKGVQNWMNLPWNFGKGFGQKGLGGKGKGLYSLSGESQQPESTYSQPWTRICGLIEAKEETKGWT